VRLGGHIRQFGNDDFLLLKIECHCFTFRRNRGAPAPEIPEFHESEVLVDPLASCDAELVAVQKILSGFTICAGWLPFRLRPGIARVNRASCALRVRPCGDTPTTCGL
jgi:hypothetical protein